MAIDKDVTPVRRVACAVVCSLLCFAAYVAAAPLDICPILGADWIGNIGVATAFDLHVDQDGNVLLAGRTGGTADLDPTEGIDERFVEGGTSDAFVTKVFADGSYAWSYVAHAVDGATASGVAVGTDGTVFLVGWFDGTVDFDPTEAFDKGTAFLRSSAFIVKLGADGEYLWKQTFGQGTDSAGADGIALTPDGCIVVVGTFNGTADFDPGGAQNLRTSDGIDVFVIKLGSQQECLWTQTFGGSGADNADDVVVDASGAVIIKGIFRGTADFDPGPGVAEQTTTVTDSIFINKLHADGSFDWARTYPIRDSSRFASIAVDAEGSIYLAGFFLGVVDFDPTEGFDVRVCNCAEIDGDIFVTKLFSDGSYAWTHTVGGVDQDFARGVAVDDLGNVFVTGQFRNKPVDFDPGPGEDVHTPIEREDAFVTALTTNGEYQWTHTFGGPRRVEGMYIAVDPQGALLVGGRYRAFTSLEADLDPSCEVDERNAHLEGLFDTFVSKLVCLEPAPDASGDGVVDLADFASFQACFTGDGTSTCGDGCSTLDLDTDDDIDLSDVGAFQSSLTGP